jgi:hypothetical protein
MSRAKFEAAKELIKERRYDEARAILETVNHPLAMDWLAKIDSIEPPKTTHPTSSPVFSSLLILGSVLTAIGFFAMPWFNLLVNLTGLDVARIAFNSGSRDIQVLSYWLIPASAAVTLLIALASFASTNSSSLSFPYLLCLMLSAASLYPLYNLFTSSRTDGPEILSGFWICLAGLGVTIVTSIMGIILGFVKD